MSHLVFLWIIGLLVLVHELGHFLAARGAGLPVARFSIGFGPTLARFRRRGTEYRVGLLPLGGYVLPGLESEDAFFAIPVRRRILFALGGPAANLLAAYAILVIVHVAAHGLSPGRMWIEPLSYTLGALGQIFAALPRIFAHPDELTGVVGIVAQGGALFGEGVLRTARAAVFLSLNFAVFNLLPLPALDGGKVVLHLMEAIHPLGRRLHLPLSVAGWLVIVGLLVYVTVLDVGRLTA